VLVALRRRLPGSALITVAVVVRGALRHRGHHQFPVILLAHARQFLQERYGRPQLIVAVIALGLPGPDPVTTGLELLPMWALFEGSIWLAFFVERARPHALAGDRFDAVAQQPD